MQHVVFELPKKVIYSTFDLHLCKSLLTWLSSFELFCKAQTGTDVSCRADDAPLIPLVR